MAGCIYAYIRSDETIISDGDLCLIKHRKVEIGKETFTYADLLSIVTVERLVDYDLIICDVSKQTLENVKASCIISRGEIVISVNYFLDGVKLLQQLRTEA